MAHDGETIVNSEKVYLEINRIDNTQESLMNDLLEINDLEEQKTYILARSYSDDSAIIEMFAGSDEECIALMDKAYKALKNNEDFDFRKK